MLWGIGLWVLLFATTAVNADEPLIPGLVDLFGGWNTETAEALKVAQLPLKKHCEKKEVTEDLKRMMRDTQNSLSIPKILYVLEIAWNKANTLTVPRFWRKAHLSYITRLTGVCEQTNANESDDPENVSFDRLILEQTDKSFIPWDDSALRIAMIFGQQAIYENIKEAEKKTGWKFFNKSITKTNLFSLKGEKEKFLVAVLSALEKIMTPELEAYIRDSVDRLERLQVKQHNFVYNNVGAEDKNIGSPRHLIFGKIIGDVLGIHPVVAGLINPSGSLVGPGNAPEIYERLGSLISAQSVLLRHSTIHDAFGLLKTVFDVGPGYTYAEDKPSLTQARMPTEGTLSGLKLWDEIFDEVRRRESNHNPQHIRI